jgi:hypothetical protein
MKKSFTVIILFLSFCSYASHPLPSWSDWEIDAHSVGCDLVKRYYIPYGYYSSFKDKPTPKGFLTDTKFIRAHMRFTAYTFTHGDIITQDELGVIRYVLQIQPATAHIRDNEKISKALIGGFEAQAKIPTIYDDMHQFWLSEKESTDLMQMLKRGETIDFSLIFTSGETKTFKVYSSTNGHVWVAMFNTCIKEHVRRRLDER